MLNRLAPAGYQEGAPTHFPQLSWARRRRTQLSGRTFCHEDQGDGDSGGVRRVSDQRAADAQDLGPQIQKFGDGIYAYIGKDFKSNTASFSPRTEWC